MNTETWTGEVYVDDHPVTPTKRADVDTFTPRATFVQQTSYKNSSDSLTDSDSDTDTLSDSGLSDGSTRSSTSSSAGGPPIFFGTPSKAEHERRAKYETHLRERRLLRKDSLDLARRRTIVSLDAGLKQFRQQKEAEAEAGDVEKDDQERSKQAEQSVESAESGVMGQEHEARTGTELHPQQEDEAQTDMALDGPEVEVKEVSAKDDAGEGVGENVQEASPTEEAALACAVAATQELADLHDHRNDTTTRVEVVVACTNSDAERCSTTVVQLEAEQGPSVSSSVNEESLEHSLASSPAEQSAEGGDKAAQLEDSVQDFDEAASQDDLAKVDALHSDTTENSALPATLSPDADQSQQTEVGPSMDEAEDGQEEAVYHSEEAQDESHPNDDVITANGVLEEAVSEQPASAAPGSANEAKLVDLPTPSLEGNDASSSDVDSAGASEAAEDQVELEEMPTPSLGENEASSSEADSDEESSEMDSETDDAPGEVTMRVPRLGEVSSSSDDAEEDQEDGMNAEAYDSEGESESDSEGEFDDSRDEGNRTVRMRPPRSSSLSAADEEDAEEGQAPNEDDKTVSEDVHQPAESVSSVEAGETDSPAVAVCPPSDEAEPEAISEEPVNALLSPASQHDSELPATPSASEKQDMSFDYDLSPGVALGAKDHPSPSLATVLRRQAIMDDIEDGAHDFSPLADVSNGRHVSPSIPSSMEKHGSGASSMGRRRSLRLSNAYEAKPTEIEGSPAELKSRRSRSRSPHKSSPKKSPSKSRAREASGRDSPSVRQALNAWASAKMTTPRSEKRRDPEFYATLSPQKLFADEIEKGRRATEDVAQPMASSSPAKQTTATSLGAATGTLQPSSMGPDAFESSKERSSAMKPTSGATTGPSPATTSRTFTREDPRKLLSFDFTQVKPTARPLKEASGTHASAPQSSSQIARPGASRIQMNGVKAPKIASRTLASSLPSALQKPIRRGDELPSLTPRPPPIRLLGAAPAPMIGDKSDSPAIGASQPRLSAESSAPGPSRLPKLAGSTAIPCGIARPTALRKPSAIPAPKASARPPAAAARVPATSGINGMLKPPAALRSRLPGRATESVHSTSTSTSVSDRSTTAGTNGVPAQSVMSHPSSTAALRASAPVQVTSTPALLGSAQRQPLNVVSETATASPPGGALRYPGAVSMLARSALSVPASRTWDSPAKLASSTSPAKPLSQSEGPASVSVTTKARRVPVSEAEISGVPVNITVFAQTTSTSSSVAPPATRLRYPASTSAVAPALSAQTTSQASAPARLTRSRLPTPPSGEREPAAVVTSQQVDPLASPMKVARRAALAGATPARTGSKATDSQGSSVDVNDVFNHPSAAGKSLRPRGAKTALPSALPVPASTQQAGPYAAPKGEPQDSGSVTTSASASTSASGGRKPRTSRAAKGTLFGAPTTAAGERLPPLPISAAELSRLTARHTRRNEVYLAKLDMHTIRVNGPRPPSPTSKVKKAIGARLNKSEAAEARASRAKRRKLGSDCSAEDESNMSRESTPSADDSNHIRGAGDEEVYSTPPRRASPTDEDSGTAAQRPRGKSVRWHKSLFAGPSEAEKIADPESRPAAALRLASRRRSCIAKEVQLDRYGNLVEAEQPLSPRLRKTKVVIRKFVYDDDDA